MADFDSTAENPVMTVAASSGAAQDAWEDACSICLESFSSEDPATVTCCKHEYHLQCILEWSQRSKECPICWQFLVLRDPASQELLAAVEIERNSRSRRRSSNTSTFPRIPPEDFEFDHVATYTDDLDFDERIMQHLAAAAMGRTHHFSRRERHRSGLGPSQFLVFAAPSNGSDVQQTYTTAPIESQSSGNSASPESNSPTTVMSSAINDQSRSSVRSPINMGSNITDTRHDAFRPGILASPTPPGSPRRSRPSELLSFSESLKSRFSAASARYKESISKSTRGFKEKLLARNNSVKELSKEVQREVTAGIAGVARMMERLDPTSKRTGGSGPVSIGTEGTSDLSHNGKGVQENLITQSPNRDDGEPAHGTSSDTPIHVSGSFSSVPGHMEVTRVQDVL